MNTKEKIEILKKWFEEISTSKIVKVDGKEYNRRNTLSSAISELENKPSIDEIKGILEKQVECYLSGTTTREAGYLINLYETAKAIYNFRRK